MRQALILFAHGSRDPQWAQPFQAIAAELARSLPHAAVRIAYLEFMRPSLEDAVAALAAEGARSIRVVPVFLGQGGHVKEDLPRLVERAAAAHPSLELSLDEAIGEQPQVIAAIAAVIAAGPRPR